MTNQDLTKCCFYDPEGVDACTISGRFRILFGLTCNDIHFSSEPNRMGADRILAPSTNWPNICDPLVMSFAWDISTLQKSVDAHENCSKKDGEDSETPLL